MNFIDSSDRIIVYEKEKQIGELSFSPVDSETISLDHTFVDPSLQGQGIASRLVQHAADLFRSQNKKVIPLCSYAKIWFSKQESYQDLLADQTTQKASIQK